MIQCTCTKIIIVLVLVMIGIVTYLIVTRTQSSAIHTHSDVPPPGKYLIKQSILGQNIDLTIDVVQTSKTTGTFDFNMQSPMTIICGQDSNWSAQEGTDSTLLLNLSPCLVTALESHDLILSSVSYSLKTDNLIGKILFKKVLPISLILKRAEKNRALQQIQKMPTYPQDCGFSTFPAQSPGAGFGVSPFMPTVEWVNMYLPHVKSTLTARPEVRSGYPQSSYVAPQFATSLPSYYHLCNKN